EIAISISPNQAEFYTLLSKIYYLRKNFEQSLMFSEKALELDSQNLDALNTMSLALIKLKRSKESFKTIEGALSEDPNNPYTHASYGWNLLETGDHKKALLHFQESLKIDPTLEVSKEGMKEAIKAGNFLYRIFLKYQFWMSKLTSKYQWGVIIGIWMLSKILNEVSERNQSLSPFINPIIYLFAGAVLLTWLIVPISNVFLRFNRYGDYLLKPFEKKNANLVAVCLLFSLFCFLIGYLADFGYLVYAGVFALLLSIPGSTFFNQFDKQWALKLLFFLMLFFSFSSSMLILKAFPFFNLMTILFFISLYAFQILINFLSIKEDNPN
ncbi:MAG: hypothetical protein SNJ77_00760, partial [Cytophagales bacterium]